MKRMEHPFANGTEGEAWRETWCGRCLHDHAAHEERFEDGCPLMLRAVCEPVFDESPPLVWQPYEQEWWRMLPAGIRCPAFEPCGPCGQPIDLRPPVYGEDVAA